jgi:cytochrome P450
MYSPEKELMKLALNVLAAASLGTRFEWVSSSTDSSASVQDAIRALKEYVIPIMVLPQCWWWLPFRFVRETKKAYLDFKVCMQELIDAKKALKPNFEGAADLISALAQTHEGEELSESEMFGNIFIFLFAGHETMYPRFGIG